MVGVRFTVGKMFSLIHCIQTGSGTQPASHQMGIGVSFLEIKVAEA
jgi:hypothetical protein